MRLDHLLSKEEYEPVTMVRKRSSVLFNFEGASRLIKKEEIEGTRPRGCSSVGRAPALQAGGHGFESHHLHQKDQPTGNPEGILPTGS